MFRLLLLLVMVGAFREASTGDLGATLAVATTASALTWFSVKRLYRR